MNVSLELPDTQYFIRSYRPGEITTNQGVHHSSLLISNQHLVEWAPQNLAELQTAHFTEVLALKPQLIIVGVGAVHRFPETALLAPLYQAKIGVEIMSTEAACRTYNILASEGRKVLAALLVG